MSACPNPTPAPLIPGQPRVIIVGTGLAGLAAATQLSKQNVPVTLLDRAAKPGGNSIKASSGINGAPTRFQSQSAPDSEKEFYEDTVRSAGHPFKQSEAGEEEMREKLIKTVTGKSKGAVEWLSDEIGVDLSKVAQLGGHSRARTHRGDGGKPPGAAIVGALLEGLKGSPFVEVRTSSRVTRVLKEAREVTGVEYVTNVEGGDGGDEKTQTLQGPVVFASGGFAGDVRGMVSKYRPDLAGFPSTNEAREGSQPLLVDIGAKLVDMDHIQVHPTGFLDTKDASATVKFLAAEALRGEGGILLLDNGKRFVNELETREHVTDIVTKTATQMGTDLRQWDVTLLLDEGAASALDSHMQFYLWKGLIRKTTMGDLGQSTINAVQEYADIVAGKKEDPYGRTAFGNWTLSSVQPDSVAYVGKVTPVLHFTMGGVLFNDESQVLDSEGEAIPGLWAAGEVTGGLHGQNRLGGSSLLECVVFGRIAGNQAAAFYQQHYLAGKA
ncbi:putative FAD dependent oxidoreductase [Aspergillus undulatus]|uniref:putative FAD dependent oxidoreductase n=1 Tax=Aspergillus undulatus TaxID=1810928 RepID=UPI003CCDB66A